MTPQIIRPRLVLGPDSLIGPGKVELLRAVAQHGSISAAARAQGMTYKRAWSLLNEVSQTCGVPVLESNAGGSGGGGAVLTDFGRALLDHYGAIETACAAAAAAHLQSLQRLLKRHQKGAR